MGVVVTAAALVTGALLVFAMAAYSLAGGQPAATFVDDAVRLVGLLWATGMALAFGAMLLGVILGVLGLGRD